MTSDQQSQSSGFTATCSGRVGRLRNRIQVMHDSVHASTSRDIVAHHTKRSNKIIVFCALLCAPKTPIWFCNHTHRFQLRCVVALPCGTTGTHATGRSLAITHFSNKPSVAKRYPFFSSGFASKAYSVVSDLWATSQEIRRLSATANFDSPASARASSANASRAPAAASYQQWSDASRSSISKSASSNSRASSPT